MIRIDYRDKRPLYEQVVDGIKELVANRILQPDEKLPSVRSLAMELSITPNTVQRAYTELEKGGYIYTVVGRGNFVSPDNELLSLKRQALQENVKEAVLAARKGGIAKECLLDILKQVYGGEPL